MIFDRGWHEGCDRALAMLNDEVAAEKKERRRLQQAFGMVHVNLRGRAESLRGTGQVIGAEECEIMANVIDMILGPGRCPACFGAGVIHPDPAIETMQRCELCDGSGRWERP